MVPRIRLSLATCVRGPFASPPALLILTIRVDACVTVSATACVYPLPTTLGDRGTSRAHCQRGAALRDGIAKLIFGVVKHVQACFWRDLFSSLDSTIVPLLVLLLSLRKRVCVRACVRTCVCVCSLLNAEVSFFRLRLSSFSLCRPT